MVYYHGKWHLYDESERREYGRRQREERSRSWHKIWISRRGLKDERLWTDKAISDFLGKPRNAGPIQAWPRTEVLAAEQTPAFRNWMDTRRAWLDARCRLPGIMYATYGLVAIGWERDAPDKPVRYQELVWNEAKQTLIYSLKWIDSPFTGVEFDGWNPEEVACGICEWFISRDRETPPGEADTQTTDALRRGKAHGK